MLLLVTPGALEPPPLLDDPQPTATTARPAVRAAAISRRRLTAPISLLLHLLVTFRRRPRSGPWAGCPSPPGGLGTIRYVFPRAFQILRWGHERCNRVPS